MHTIWRRCIKQEYLLNNILLIVEGARDETKLLKSIFDKFLPNSSSYCIYAYKTNIYQLYNKIKGDEFLDLLRVLKETPGNTKNEIELLSTLYSDVYLIFDYEKNAHHFNSTIIEEMLDYFDNETENGRLYINYPMMESYKDFINYEYTKIKKIRLSKLKKYKKTV